MIYATIHLEGGFLPPDMLDRIAAGDSNLPGLRASDFGLDGRRLGDELQDAYSYAQTEWQAFRRRYERAKQAGQSATTVTREGWINPLLERLDYVRRGYTLVRQPAAVEAGNERFVISHRAGEDPTAPPVHIVGFDDELDRRGEHRRSPHASVQEYLNRSDALWGIVTNGKSIRLLRRNERLAKSAYLEFDLAGMMDSNVYSEFALLYLVLHRTRLPRNSAEAPDCFLEQWYQRGIDEGGRVRERLRDGVEAALKRLGNALLQHERSAALREAIASGRLAPAAYYRELLRLIYRLLFLMVAEERRLMFPETRENEARRAIFSEHYGIRPLRDRADRYISDDPQIDLWERLKRTFVILRDDRIARMLGIAALNGELFGPRVCEHVEAAACRNDELLRAIHALSTFVDDGGVRRRVNYAGLDVEELGSVYESLLDYHPEVSAAPPHFDLVAGSERKATGSYYTPPALVGELIKSALEPVVEERLKAAPTGEAKEAALLGLRVIDPACGSGHFLLAAARRIGKELARIRTGEEEPSVSDQRHAVRDVIRECIYAVDKNPLAVDLCKVALWIEGLNAGQPLSFLDHHVKCGDSLVGVFDLKVLQDGIPDDAYKAVEGDDKAAAKHYRALNREAKKNHPTLPLFRLPDNVTAALEALSHRDERTPEDVAANEREYAELVNSPAMQNLENACNAWTAAFFVPLRMPEFRGRDLVPTSSTVWERLSGRQIYGPLDGEIAKAKFAYSFFHWPVEFPDVFTRGGFDVVLGNPPWERIKLQEKEFFASRDPKIARAANKAAREKLIKELPKRKPELAAEFAAAVHGAEAQSNLVRASGRYPLCGRGDVNTYSIFTELARALAGKAGRAGIIVPSGIATDDTTKFFFRDLMESHSLASLFDFENRKKLFPAVDSRMKFCLLTMAGGGQAGAAEFVFFALGVDELRDPERRISLSAEDIALLNPNTRTCPIFRTRRDAEITKAIYRRVPVLIREGPPEENPWGIKFATMFHMSNDSHLFRTREQLEHDGWKLEGNIFIKGRDRYLPLYEAKMAQLWDHRAADVVRSATATQRQAQPRPLTLSEHSDPYRFALPLYWVSEADVRETQHEDHSRDWLLGFTNVTSPTNERTFLPSVIPLAAVGHSMPLILFERPRRSVASLIANLSSYALDFLTRQKIGGVNLTFFIVQQLPCLPPSVAEKPADWSRGESVGDWVGARALELTFTAWDIGAFARDLGYDGPPFRWDEERRFFIRCELDAAFFHLYGISRDDADYIMETFPIVKRKDEERFGEYRTKRVILEIYDEMAEAIRTGRSYQTRLDPPPGDPRAAHQSVSLSTNTRTQSSPVAEE